MATGHATTSSASCSIPTSASTVVTCVGGIFITSVPRRKRPAFYTPRYAWDGKWHALDYHGQIIIFFERAGLAIALNRSVAAIRAMERKGIICKPKVKLPTYPHQWLYTEGQIADMITLAEEEGVINPNYRKPFSKRFINEAHSILSRMP